MKESVKPINKRIATYRKLAGYTQQTAADALGIKKNTYARMELHGNPTPDMLVSLAKLYNISPNLILFGTDAAAENTAPSVDETKDTRLKEEPQIFRKKPDLVLTINEENCIKACRKLSKEDRNKVMELINKLYGESKGSV